MKLFALLFALFAVAASAPAEELVYVDKFGVALHGFDPVAYFTHHRPVEGNPQFSASHKGGLYHFATAEHRDLFRRNPEKYAPQFGGYCGYAASINAISPTSPHYWQIIDGRLVLQHNQKAWDLWIKDVPGNLKKADAHWPKLSQRKRGPFGL